MLTAKIAGVTHCINVAFSEALLKSGQAQQERCGRCGGDLRGRSAALDAVRAREGHRAAVRIDVASGAQSSGPAAHNAGQCITRSHGRIRHHCTAGSQDIVEILTKTIAHEQNRIPELARSILETIVDQLNGTMVRIREIEERLARWHRQSRVSRLLATVPGVGIMGASAIAATVVNPTLFRSGREFAAWLGMRSEKNLFPECEPTHTSLPIPEQIYRPRAEWSPI